MKRVKIKIRNILFEQEKNVLWLSKQTGINPNSLGKLVKNQTDSIRFENIIKICDALNVELTDIMEIEEIED